MEKKLVYKRFVLIKKRQKKKTNTKKLEKNMRKIE